MKKKQVLILLFCVTAFASAAQTPISTIEKKLLDSVSLRVSLKTYILLETDTFILFTPSKYFMEPFAQWINEHPELKTDKMLYKALANDTGKRTVRANKIADEYNLSKNMLPQIAECLRIGKCIIYNKTTELLEKKVTIEDYLINNHGEVRYKVNESLLFMVYD